MTMIVVRNIGSYRVGISSSYSGAHGRPLYMNLQPRDIRKMNSEDLKKWGPGAKETLASYVQNGTLRVDEVQVVHEADDLGHKVPAFSAMDLESSILYADALRHVYNAHAINGGVHTAPDTTNVETSAVPTTVGTLSTFIASLQGNYDAHIVLGSAHPNADSFNATTLAPGTLTASIAALKELAAIFTMHKKQSIAAGAVALTVPQIITY
jgi:hypothetical protein